MPDTASESRDVDLVVVGRIGNDPVRPLEVEPGNPRPVLTSIVRAPGGRFKSGRVQNARVIRIDGDVVNVAVAVKDLPPGPASIFRKKDATAIPMCPRGAAPSCQVQTLRDRKSTRLNSSHVRIS